MTPEAENLYNRTQKIFDQIDKLYTEVEVINKLMLAIAKENVPGCDSVGDEECVESPVGLCVYDTINDPCCNECLICGLPDERK